MSDLFGFLSVAAMGAGRAIDGSVIALHVISALVTSLACFCAALGIAWYARHRRGMADEYRQVAMLLCTFAGACGLTRLVDAVMVWFPYYWVLAGVEALTAALTLVAALAVWPKLPELIALPSSRDLQRANDRLAAEEVARGALVERLTRLNGELEERVARRTCELEEATRRFLTLFDQNDTRWQFFFEFVQGIDPDPVRQKIYQKVRSLKTPRVNAAITAIKRHVAIGYRERGIFTWVSAAWACLESILFCLRQIRQFPIDIRHQRGIGSLLIALVSRLAQN